MKKKTQRICMSAGLVVALGGAVVPAAVVVGSAPVAYAADATYVDINNQANFPDSQLRSLLLTSADTSKDGTLSPTEIANFKKLEITSGAGIYDLKGIEFLTGLTTLKINGTSVSGLDLSKNTLLETVDLSNNQLTSLSLGNNSKLRTVDVSNNKLTSLNFPNNPYLTTLNATNNQLTSISFNIVDMLSNITLTNNKFTSLDLSKTIASAPVLGGQNAAATTQYLNGFWTVNFKEIGVDPNYVTILDSGWDFDKTTGIAKKTSSISTVPTELKYSVSIPASTSRVQMDVTLKLASTASKVTDIALTPTTVTVAKGGTTVIKAVITPTTATNQQVAWNSTNPDVATVDGSGKVTGKNYGTTLIYATTVDGGKVATATVTVADVDGVTVTPSTATLASGETTQLKAAVTPTTANQEVTWSSSNASVATVSATGLVTAVTPGSVTITATTKTGAKVGTSTITVTDKTPSVNYSVHVQTYGWRQGYRKNGQSAGTTGESKRLEAIRANISDAAGVSGGIEYRTHVQTYGWEQTWAANNGLSGTSGQSKRLEGIQMRLTGDLAEKYDIYYRVHAQTYGWLDWAKNGQTAGTTGLSRRLESIQIQLVKKGDPAPGKTTRPNVTKYNR